MKQLWIIAPLVISIIKLTLGNGRAIMIANQDCPVFDY